MEYGRNPPVPKDFLGFSVGGCCDGIQQFLLRERGSLFSARCQVPSFSCEFPYCLACGSDPSVSHAGFSGGRFWGNSCGGSCRRADIHRGVAMAPAPALAPAPAPAPAPAVALAAAVEDDGAGDKNKEVALKSEDVSMADKDDEGDHSVPCPETSGVSEVAPGPVEYKGGDTTESSSSFGGTFSGFSDEEEGGEPEVSSLAVAPVADGGSSMLPSRKKVTAEWRNSVRPYMWRCQWLELQMKELSSKVAKYDRELALIEKEKKLQQGVSQTNGSTPDPMLIGKDHRNSIMERRKRRRHEDVADTSLYIKKHPILSLYNDKQNRGVETDGVLLDDDCRCSGDTVALLDAKEYDMILEQVSLNDILSTINMAKSRVHMLQDRLNKAHLQEDNLAFSEDNTQVRVPRKRQSTQRFRDTSYTMYQSTKSQKCRNAKQQKRKNLNILSKDDDGLALAVQPCSPEGDTSSRIEGSEGKSGEWNLSQDRAIGMALLLGVDNSLPNGHMGDLYNENADDVLIDNQSANEGCPQFVKIEPLPSEISSSGQNTSTPVEEQKTSEPVEEQKTSEPVEEQKTSEPVEEQNTPAAVEVQKTSVPVEEQNTSASVKLQKTSPQKVDGISAPLKVESTSATVFNQEPLLEKSSMLKPVKKRAWRPRERNSVWGSACSAANLSIGASVTLDTEQKPKDAAPCSEVKSEPMDLDIPLSAWKKRKAGDKSTAAEEDKAGSLPSKKQKTGPSAGNKSTAADETNSATKKQHAENSSPAAKKQETAKKTPPKLMVEKAVLVAVNSRRSQRVRKPKVY